MADFYNEITVHFDPLSEHGLNDEVDEILYTYCVWWLISCDWVVIRDVKNESFELILLTIRSKNWFNDSFKSTIQLNWNPFAVNRITEIKLLIYFLIIYFLHGKIMNYILLYITTFLKKFHM